MLYQIHKSNRSGRWTGRQWWVEAESEQAAIAIGRKNWPSRNVIDEYHATPLTEEEIDAYYAEQAEIQIRFARRPGPCTSAAADRLAAYHARCGQNKLAALNRNVTVLGYVSPALEACAERIEADTMRRIDDCYR